MLIKMFEKIQRGGGGEGGGASRAVFLSTVND